MPKVIVGMSGGVDSSVAAYLLKEQGYEVEGLSFILTNRSLQAIEAASKTARYIGIPHSTIDAEDEFVKNVIKPFADAYTTGSTPNPCILCNRFIKFPFLLKEAEKRGAEYISTGHYARVEKIQDTRHKIEADTEVFLLKKGIDPKKDQSYVLHVLKQEELKRLILPLGYYRKDEVRKIAQELDLPSAKKAESQEICFIEDRNYFKFIEHLSSVAGEQGPIIDITGKVIGVHKGIHGYTIGQRKGLGISSPEPLYVLKIDALNNVIYAGPCDAAKKKDFLVKDLNWILPVCGEGEATPRPYRVSVKVRSMMKDEPATIYLESKPPTPLIPPLIRGDKEGSTKGGMGGLSGEIVRVLFDEPQWAPAPGQSAVFYDGDILLGGGVIT